MRREAISLTRCSTRPQEKGDSLRRQRDAYERVCERYSALAEKSERYGFGTFSGSGESGFHGQNIAKGGSLRSLLDRMKDGTIDPHKSCLVVEAFDRLSRLEPDLAMQLLSDIVRSGCPVVVDSPDLWIEASDLGGPKFILIAAMMQLAHAESKQKSQRVKASWERRKATRSERPVTTLCPSWIQADNGKWTVIPEKAAVVQRIYAMCVAGTGLREIAKALNGEQIPLLSGRANATWTMAILARLLRNRLVLGEYQPRVVVKADGKRRRVKSGNPSVGYYPAIIDTETFVRVQVALAQRRSLKGRPPTRRFNLFNGILWSATDKRRMNAETQVKGGKSYTYLVPYGALQAGEKRVSISYDAFEAGFLAFTKAFKGVACAPTVAQEEIDRERALIERLTAEMERLTGEEDPDAVLPFLRKKTEARRAAERRLEALERRAQELNPAAALDDCASFSLTYDAHCAAGRLAEFEDMLRNKVRAAVSEIWLLIRELPKRRRVAVAQVFLRAGPPAWFGVETASNGSWEIMRDVSAHVDPARDLRLWKP